MAIIISTQKFNANLKRLDDESLRELVAECFAYALYHFHKDGQKTPFLNMQKAVEGSKSFLADIVRGLSLGKRDSSASEDSCVRQADAIVAVVFADKKTQKELRAANRKPRAVKAKQEPAAQAAPQSEPADVVEVPMIESGLIIGGELVDLTPNEADALYDTLMAIRNAGAKVEPVRLAA